MRAQAEFEVVGRGRRLRFFGLRLVIFTLALVGTALIAELALRVYTDGLSGAWAGLRRSVEVPYSNLGTSNWVVYDKELGYRLNPDSDEIHDVLSIRSGDVELPKPAGVFRLLVLGDSVPWDLIGFVGRIRKALSARPSIEVVNAAVPGYTSYQEVLFFERFLAVADPDLVLWTYCLNDNHRFLHHFDEDANMLVTEEAWDNFDVDSTWDRIVSRSYLLTRWRGSVLAREKLAGVGETRFPWERRVDFKTAWNGVSWDDYEKDLVRLQRALAPGTQLAIVAFPYEPQLSDWPAHDLDYVLEPQRRLAAVAREHGVPVLDLYPVFARAYRGKGSLYRDGVHLSDPGHALATRTILKFLTREALLPGD